MVAVVAPTTCLFCVFQLVTVPAAEGLLYCANCPRCGSYRVSYADNEAVKRQLRDEDRPIFSQWIYEQNRLGTTPTISISDVASIASRQKFGFAERVRRCILYFHERSTGPGDQIDILCPPLQAALQTFDQKYIGTIAHYLSEEKLATVGLPGPVRQGQQRQMVSLTPRGSMQAEEWGQSYTLSAQGFVAMWFDNTMETAWRDGFYRAIDEAGYIPRRIDKKEHINKICDEIIAEIRKSRFVVADFWSQILRDSAVAYTMKLDTQAVATSRYFGHAERMNSLTCTSTFANIAASTGRHQRKLLAGSK